MINHPADPGLKAIGSFLRLSTACVVGVCTFASTPAQAQNIQSTQSSSVGAQIQYNNTWGQSFEVIGPNIGGGEAGIITPFATTSTESLTITPILPNSGAAEFSATVENLSVEGGDLQASGKFTEIPEGSNIVINPSNTTGIPSITIDSTASGSDSTIGASILGTNVGVESIQVTGTFSNTVMNDDLTAF